MKKRSQAHHPLAALGDPSRLLREMKGSLTAESILCLTLSICLSMKELEVGMKMGSCMSLVVFVGVALAVALMVDEVEREGLSSRA